MGFEVLNRRSARASGVAVNVTKNSQAKEGHGLSGFFRIAPDVAREAGWNDPERMKVQILMGNGSDVGHFILKPDAAGKTVPFKPKSGASLQVSFSAMSAGFVAPTGGTKEVGYRVEGDTIRIDATSLLASDDTTKSRKTARRS